MEQKRLEIFNRMWESAESKVEYKFNRNDKGNTKFIKTGLIFVKKFIKIKSIIDKSFISFKKDYDEPFLLNKFLLMMNNDKYRSMFIEFIKFILVNKFSFLSTNDEKLRFVMQRVTFKIRDPILRLEIFKTLNIEPDQSIRVQKPYFDLTLIKKFAPLLPKPDVAPINLVHTIVKPEPNIKFTPNINNVDNSSKNGNKIEVIKKVSQTIVENECCLLCKSCLKIHIMHVDNEFKLAPFVNPDSMVDDLSRIDEIEKISDK